MGLLSDNTHLSYICAVSASTSRKKPKTLGRVRGSMEEIARSFRRRWLPGRMERRPISSSALPADALI